MATKNELRTLRVKIKSLAAESRIIRDEMHKEKKSKRHKEARWGRNPHYWRLAEHRQNVVRREARHANLVYGMLRGIPCASLEPTVRPGNYPQWSKLREMARRFKTKAVTQEQIEDWIKDADRFYASRSKGAAARAAA